VTARPAPVALQGAYLDPPSGPTQRILHPVAPFMLPAAAGLINTHRQDDQVHLDRQHFGKDLDQCPVGPSRAAPAPIESVTNRDRDHIVLRMRRRLQGVHRHHRPVK